jgi:uncharacterized membrane protein
VRSIVKAVIWRVVGTFFTTAVAWLVTGSAKAGLSIGLIDSALKVGSFYAHERLWQKVRAARTAWPAALGQIVLRLGRDGGVHVVFKGPVKPAAEMLQCLGAGTAILCWWQPAEGRARLLTAGQASRSDPAAAPATVFEQVNPTMGDRVRVHALRELGAVSGSHVWELYAEALLGLGNPPAAVAEYRRVLLRTPHRPAALLGLARAARAAGDGAQSASAAAEFLRIWHGADTDRPELREARDLAGAGPRAR